MELVLKSGFSGRVNSDFHSSDLGTASLRCPLHSFRVREVHAVFLIPSEKYSY